MSKDLEDWETQQEAKRAAAHKEGPLSFLAGGGAAASRKITKNIEFRMNSFARRKRVTRRWSKPR